jgi:excisionase family DNA binding protein
MSTARDRLGRFLGSDALELLDAYVREQVEEALAYRQREDRWMTPEVAAERLGVSASSLRKRAARGTIPFTRLPGLDGKSGRRLLLDMRALDAALEEGRR